MGRRAVEIVIELLDVFAVVAFVIGQAKEPFFEDRVMPVPQRQGQAKQQLIVAKTPNPVLAPAIGAAPRVVVREIIPCIAVFAVVFAHRAPLPFAEVWPPTPPLHASQYFFKARAFRSKRSCRTQPRGC